MKGLKLMIIEIANRQAFTETMNVVLPPLDVFSVKLQRNLYYAGVGSSAGRTPGVTVPCPPKEELSESYVGFVLYTP